MITDTNIAPSSGLPRQLGLIAFVVGVMAVGFGVVAEVDASLMYMALACGVLAMALAIPALISTRHGMAMAGLVLGAMTVLSTSSLLVMALTMNDHCGRVTSNTARNPVCSFVQETQL